MALTRPFFKNLWNTQFARISTLAGIRNPYFAPVNGPFAPDDGIEPLADNNGRLISRIALANGFVTNANPFPVSIPGGILGNVNATIVSPLYQGFVAVKDKIGGADTFSQSSGGGYAPAVGISTGPGNYIIRSFSGFCDNPASCYLQFFNAGVVPTTGVTLPELVIPLSGGTGILLPERLISENFWYTNWFSGGITFALSSTRTPFTVLASPFLNYNIIFRLA